ncbi:LOW QUALITY PROTEIN: ankyrin-2-like [Liolophura sinensis]|uniref:LOW QUALITY PROTEIN: ankyrin-2-like n=1 Tax=Liolophura sinensis TaxID=3198878 RepID=UPI003158B68B
MSIRDIDVVLYEARDGIKCPGTIQSNLFQHLLISLKEKPLEFHAYAGKQLVYLLSLHGVDINMRTDSGNTPLQEYLDFPTVHPAVVEAFLRCNADAYAPNKEGRTPFALAYFNPRLAKALKAVFMQYVPGLWRAVEGDDVMNVRKLVNQWCHTNIFKDGKSLTQLACDAGSENVVRVVRDIKPSMDLAHAVLSTDVQRARLILTSGDTVNVNFHNMGDLGATPLNYAILNNDCEMVDLLLDNGARLDIPLTQGEHEIPLFMSLLSGDHEIEVKTLCKVVDRLSKNNMKKMFFRGSNLLLHCIDHDVEPEVVDCILKKGGAALLTCRDQDNLTARDLADISEKTRYVDLMDQVVSDWYFYPETDDCNRKLLCLHAYPSIPRVPLVPSHESDSGHSPDLKNRPTGHETDTFWDKREEYLRMVEQFHSAVEEGNLESAGQLIYVEHYSRNFEPCLADGRTKVNFQPALHKAVLRGNRDIMRLLVEAFLFLLGHRLDFVRDQFHRTVLHYAMAAEGSEDMVAYLAENGASEHVMDKDGRSPQVFKDRKGQSAMRDLLRYHLLQDFTQAEPDPWSVPMPVPIIGYLKKCAQDHKHGHRLGLSHHHHYHHHTTDRSHHHVKAAKNLSAIAQRTDDLDDEITEESETESNQETNRYEMEDKGEQLSPNQMHEQSSWCLIL